MSKQVKRRRGTAAEIALFTPAEAEWVHNTTDNSIHIGDGVTVGGFKIPHKPLPLVNTALELITSSTPVSAGFIKEVDGFTNTNDIGGGRWKATGNIIDVSQSPSLTGSNTLSDALGQEFELIIEGAMYPESLGVIGDGVTVENLAFQAVLNSMVNIEANNSYLIDNTTGLLVQSNTNISGSGVFDTGSSSINRGIFDLSNKDNITISDITLKSLRAGDTVSTDNTGITGNGCTNIIIDGVTIQDFGFYAIYMFEPEDVKVTNCRMTNLGRAGFLGLGCLRCDIHDNFIKDISPGSGGVAPFINAYGIVFSMDEDFDDRRSQYCSAINNHIENVDSWEGIDLHGSTDILLQGNTIINCAIGMFIGSATGSADLPPERVQIIGNTLDNTDNVVSRAGILLSASPDAGVTVGHEFTISNNLIKGYGTHDIAETQEAAIDVRFARDVTISSNNLVSNRYAHIRLKEDLISCSIIGNTFRRGIAVDSQIWVLIIADGSEVGCLFEGNVAYREGGTLNGIWIQVGPSSEGVYGARIGFNEFANLTLDFEASSAGRMHSQSPIFLANTTQAKIASTGTIRNDVNVTSINKTGTGTYELTLTKPYISANNINALVSGVGNNARICNATPTAVNTVEVKVFDATGSLIDNEFQFQASGKIDGMPGN